MVTARCYIVSATLMNIWMDGYIADVSLPCLCLCRDEMAMVLVNTQVHYLVFTAVDDYAKYFLTIQWSDSGSVDDTQQLE